MRSMDKLQDTFQAIVTILQIVVAGSATALLSIVGLVLLVLAGLAAYLALTRKETPRFVPFILYFSLVVSALFSAAGPGLALFWVSQAPLSKVSAETAFDNLTKNERVDWLVRLVPYQTGEPQLAVGKLQNLGPPRQLFTFVGVYEELSGYSVKDSVEMSGLTFNNSNTPVSAIIFPLGHAQLYPANARGLLQVILEVEARKDIETPKPFLRGQNSLSQPELDDLKDVTIESYQVDKFRDKYPHYCSLAQQFRCHQTSYSAYDYIGGLSDDWHPLGFAQRPPRKTPATRRPAQPIAHFQIGTTPKEPGWRGLALERSSSGI